MYGRYRRDFRGARRPSQIAFSAYFRQRLRTHRRVTIGTVQRQRFTRHQLLSLQCACHAQLWRVAISKHCLTCFASRQPAVHLNICQSDVSVVVYVDAQAKLQNDGLKKT